MQQPQRCTGSLPQPLPSMLQIKQTQKIYCWKLSSLLAVLKVSINSEKLAQSVKQLARASPVKQWPFPFSPAPWSQTPLGTHGVRHPVTDSTEIFVRAVKNSPLDKNPGHSLTNCTRYLNSDAQAHPPPGAAWAV